MSNVRSAEPGRKAAYSPDIRWRVIWQRLGMGLSFREIARNLSIATSTAFAAFRRFEETGEISGKKQPARESLRRLEARDEIFIVGLVLENPSLYLQEMCRDVADVLGKQVSAPTICRVLARHGFTRKKIQQVAKQRNASLRAAFAAEIMHCFHRNMLVWVDETGCDRRSHIRKCGYAFRGEAPVYHRILHRGERISSIAAMSVDGVIALESHKGSVNAEVFADFIRGSLVPQMRPFDGESPTSVVVMDNCSIHHTELVMDLLKEAGIVVIFLPPYSPDYNPIELVFGYIKAYLKHHDELLQALSDPLPVIKAAFESITPQQCQSWITHAGYM